jgi:hypothetical protein
MNDDTLILYYYDDGLDDAERRAVRTALDTDPALAERYRQLAGELEVVGQQTAAAIPADLQQRLHAAVDRAADREIGHAARPARHSHWFGFLLGAGLTAAIALLIGLRMQATDESLPDAVAPLAGALPTTADNEPVFMRTMQVYFRDSRREVQTLAGTGNGERSEMILNLIADNRRFARLAARNDAGDLARVLRAFEPILTRLAAEDITAEESAALREKLDFELNVMLTKLTREASEIKTSSEQET